MISIYILVLTTAIIVVGLSFIFKMNRNPEPHKFTHRRHTQGRHLSRSDKREKRAGGHSNPPLP